MGSWSDTALTWNTQPPVGSTVGGPVTVTSSDPYTVIDVTPAVQAWYNETSNNYGLRLDRIGGTGCVFWATKEHSEPQWWPKLEVTYTEAEAGIYGTVTENGNPAEGIPLRLLWYDGSPYSTVATTTTDADGNYLFTDLPTLEPDQTYAVQYSNPNCTGGRLNHWWSGHIRSYTAGDSVWGGDFNIADIILDSPADGATVSLPQTFQWNRRGTDTDDYMFMLYDPIDSDPWWDSEHLAYEDSYTLPSLPSGFTYGTEYAWIMAVYGPTPYDASAGMGCEFRRVTFSQPPSVDLTVTHLEVTQAIQDWDNTIPLVEDKWTWVRVYVDCGAECTHVDGVTAQLRGYRGGEPLGSATLLNGPIEVLGFMDDSDRRMSSHNTLNFWLPDDWLSGSITLTAEVNPPGADRIPESDYSNNQREESVVFHPRVPMEIGYVKINYQPPESCPPCKQADQLRRGNPSDDWIWGEPGVFLRKVYPIPTAYAYLAGGFLWDQCLVDSNGETNSEISKLLIKELNTLNDMLPDPPDYLFGWLPQGAYCGGKSDPDWWPAWPLSCRYAGKGQVAFADEPYSDKPSVQRAYEGVMAHEIGHLLGRRHSNTASCRPDKIDECSDWPYEKSLIDDWGFDGTESPGQVMTPFWEYDIMSYCYDTWVSKFTYKKLYEKIDVAATGPSQVVQSSSPQEYLVVSGFVTTDDSVDLDPIWRVTSEVPPSDLGGTDYCIEFQDGIGNTLETECFDLTFVDSETFEPTTLDVFTARMPYHPEMASVVLKHDGVVLGEVPVSVHVPSVTVLSPNGGESWSGTEVATWEASDSDGDTLTYTVMHSADGGSSWVPVSIAITQTTYLVDSTQLAGSTNALIKVIASDGVNNGEDQSDAAFAVATKPPWPTILAPEDRTVVAPEHTVFFWGEAYDLEDGTLEDVALSWSSDIDGFLGTGSQLLVNSLTPGAHSITLTATDSDGQMGTDSVGLFVGHKIYLPLILKNY